LDKKYNAEIKIEVVVIGNRALIEAVIQGEEI
jgi:hypothetical protein